MKNFLIPVDRDVHLAQSASAYDAWFREKVSTSLRDARPGVSHAQAMVALRASLLGECDHIKVQPEA